MVRNRKRFDIRKEDLPESNRKGRRRIRRILRVKDNPDFIKIMAYSGLAVLTIVTMYSHRVEFLKFYQLMFIKLQKAYTVVSSSYSTNDTEQVIPSNKKLGYLKRWYFIFPAVIGILGTVFYFDNPVKENVNDLFENMKGLKAVDKIDSTDAVTVVANVGSKPLNKWDVQDYTNAGSSGLFYLALLGRKYLINWALEGVPGGKAAKLGYKLCFGPNRLAGPFMPTPLAQTEDPTAFMLWNGYFVEPIKNISRAVVCAWENSTFFEVN